MRQAGVIAIVAIVFIVVLSFILLGGGLFGAGPGHMRWWDHQWSGWGFIWGMLMILLWPAITIAVVAGLAWLLGQGRSEREPAGGPVDDDPDRPLQTLQERYARGEISKDEFDEMRRDLQ